MELKQMPIFDPLFINLLVFIILIQYNNNRAKILTLLQPIKGRTRIFERAASHAAFHWKIDQLLLLAHLISGLQDLLILIWLIFLKSNEEKGRKVEAIGVRGRFCSVPQKMHWFFCVSQSVAFLFRQAHPHWCTAS